MLEKQPTFSGWDWGMRLREEPSHVLCPPACSHCLTFHTHVLLSSSVTNSSGLLRWPGKNKVRAKPSPCCRQTCMLYSYESSRSCLPVPLLRHAAQKATACFRAATWFAIITHWGCWFSLPVTKRPGHAYSEMFPVSPLPPSSKRLLPSVHPSSGPQHVPLVWLYHASPFMPSLAWISLLISNCADLITLACVCVCNPAMWCNEMLHNKPKPNVKLFKQPSYLDYFFLWWHAKQQIKKILELNQCPIPNCSSPFFKTWY